MANKIGISPSMLSSIENGVRFPPENFLDVVMNTYKLHGRERDSFLVGYMMASETPLEFDMEEKCNDEAYMRVACFLAFRLKDAAIEDLQDVCIRIENSIVKKKYHRDDIPISKRKELPGYLPDCWCGIDNEKNEHEESLSFSTVAKNLSAKKKRKKQDTKNIGKKESTENED